jgi:hypothetical protein
VTKSPAPRPWRNPLTGLRGGRGGRFLVAKIDNTRPSHPQIGLQAADVGYIEEVEGGLTRMAVVFESKLPPVVGPVRSARETDIGLFAQYGRTAFAYSGAQPTVTRELQGSRLQLEVDGFGGGWFRGYGRSAPYNLFARPSSLLTAVPHSAKLHDVGFRFGGAPSWMHHSHGFSVTYPAAHIAWSWSPSRHGFVLAMDGSPSQIVGRGQLLAKNVIVQYVNVYRSRLHDVLRNPTPYTVTVGHGSAVFFRDGKVVHGSWSRASKTAGTFWHVGKKAQPYHLEPGNTWIVLVPRTMRVHQT